MNLISIDVETANIFKDSICQIGWAKVEEGVIVQVDSMLINPCQSFDKFNEELHGITAEVVSEAPTFPEVKEGFRRMMNSVPVLSYGLFDRWAFELADNGDHATHFVDRVPWVNAQRIVRRAWPEDFRKKYNLTLVAETLGLPLKAHDAASDAEVVARAVILAADKLSMNFEELIERAYQRMTPARENGGQIRISGGEHGPLAGEVVVFTGALDVPRAEAAALANGRSAAIKLNVTKKTTILVVGVQDASKIVSDKSKKHE